MKELLFPGILVFGIAVFVISLGYISRSVNKENRRLTTIYTGKNAFNNNYKTIIPQFRDTGDKNLRYGHREDNFYNGHESSFLGRNSSFKEADVLHPLTVSSNDIAKWYTFDFSDFPDIVARKGRVYYSIFAGRMHFMKIHLHYTDMLLARNLVDEVHIWDFCQSNETNRAYLHEFMNSPRRDPRYVLMANPPENNNRFCHKRGEGYLWEKYYDHYSTDRRYKDEDILVKADDDIVFLDVTKFGAFVERINTPNIYFPNIGNNDAGLFIQGQREAHPTVTNTLAYYESMGCDAWELFNTYYFTNTTKAFHLQSPFICPLSSFNCPAPGGKSWLGGLFLRGDLAGEMHMGFLEDPHAFIQACANEFFPRFVRLRRRISVNFFAGRFALIRKVFVTFLDHHCCDDEGYIGVWPSITKIDHIIDTHFTVMHYGFKPQYTTDTKDFSRFFGRYEKLALQIQEELFGYTTSTTITSQHHHRTNSGATTATNSMNKNTTAHHHVWSVSRR